MNAYVAILLILLSILLQTSSLRVVLHRFPSPDLLLALTVCWCLLRNRREGLWVAAAGGIAQDMLSAGPFGTATTALFAVAFVAGTSRWSSFRGSRWLPGVVTAAATVTHQSVYAILLALASHPIALAAWLQTVGGLTAANVAVTYGLIWPLSRAEERRRADSLGSRT